MLSVSRETLKKIARDFYNITRLKITFFSKERKVILSYPPENIRSPICAIMHQHPETCALCYKCDFDALNTVKFRHEPYIYTCHAGLTEAIAQIYENEVFIGYIMVGQFLISGTEDEALQRLEEISKRHGISNLVEKLALVEKRERDFTESAVSIMQAYACYITTHNIIKNNADILSAQITEYIKEHLNEDLNVEKICKELYISRARLYDVSSKIFKRGIMDYVNILRMDRASFLLLTTSMKVYEIAEAVGFSDTKYFVRKFRQVNKITPLQYRKLKA